MSGTSRIPSPWGLFRLPHLTLEIDGPDRAVVRREVAVTGRETALRLDVPFVPTEVRVDPEGKLLLRTTAVATGR